MKKYNVDGLNEKNQCNGVWEYTTYFDPMEFEVHKVKRTYWRLVVVFLIVLILEIYYFYEFILK